MLPGTLPTTVEEGRRLFPGFNEAHLRRRLRFLSPAETAVKTALAGWARMGSNFIKYYMEEIAGVVMGDDHDNRHNAAKMLLAAGEYLGKVEGTYLVKTHWPFLKHHRCDEDLAVARAIVLFRNPLYSMSSLFQLILSNSHTLKLPAAAYVHLPVYDELMRFYAVRWSEFMEYWHRQALPKYWLTYESFLADPETQLGNLFAVCLNQPIAGTELARRIQTHIAVHGMKSAYLNRPHQHTELVRQHPRPLIEFIYRTCQRWIIEGGWAAEYESYLGLPASVPCRPEQSVFAENQRTLELAHRRALPSEVGLIISSDRERDWDQTYESIRPRVHALRAEFGLAVEGI